MLVALTGLDGVAVQVETTEVFSLTTVPATLLPAGVPNGTYITSEDGGRVAVQGTVAATAAVLSGGAGGVYAGSIVGGTGAINLSTGNVACVRNGAGDYTITLTVAPTVALQPTATLGAAAGFIAIRMTALNTAAVLTFNVAGAAADADFNFRIMTQVA